MNLLTFPLDAPEFDVAKLEKLQQCLAADLDWDTLEPEIDYTSKNDLGISAEEVDCNFTDDFHDGKIDGEHNFKPVAYQWSSLHYRQGYLTGMMKRIGIKYTLIRGVKTSKIIVLD